ncbi:MAG TPA: hypothetical protein VHT70_03780 [Candidatus Saccharimonadales bacterium]|nr:hypothetical protein [Candidatus Saccharimonadales bacterium]
MRRDRLFVIGIIAIALMFALVTIGSKYLWRSKSTTYITVTSPPHPPKQKPFTFPAGGRTLLPDYRFVALYGTPGMPVLGALGEQPPSDAIARIKDIATSYQPYSSEPIYPTFEMITTIASASPTDNGDYSQEVPAATLQPWIDAARQAGVYVVLDLQPGRTDFLTQAEEYADLLQQPNVGLALDPEWRLGPTQVPLVQIGSVDVSEINATADWLATLTRQNKLPQKLFVLHQFRLSMITNRGALNTTHPELANIIQMDGNGTQPTKLDTWNTIHQQLPPHVYMGWKNFYKVDSPMLAPGQTMQLTPQPWYVSYQ